MKMDGLKHTLEYLAKTWYLRGTEPLTRSQCYIGLDAQFSL